MGGELSFRSNLTRSRATPRISIRSRRQPSTAACARSTTADSGRRIPTNCLLRGVPGTYTRFSAEATWRRTFIDPYGQMFTPFVSLRGDVAAVKIDNQAGVSNYIKPGETNVVRVMPTVGLEYRYPFISVQSWGTQTIRTDRAADLPSERDQRRPAAQRRRAEPDLRRLQPVQGQQVLRLGPRRGRQPRRMSASSTPRSSTAAATSTSCSGSPISCSDRTRSRSAA